MRPSTFALSCALLFACGDDPRPAPDTTADTAPDTTADADSSEDTAPDAAGDTSPDASDPCGACVPGAECDTSAATPTCRCDEGLVGDGSACAAPVALTRFEVLPQPMRRGELARVVVESLGATGCTLSLGAWTRALDADELADGGVELTLPEAALGDFAEVTRDGRPATLVCQGGDAGAVINEARRTAAVIVDPGLPVELVAADPSLAEGGTLNVCWRAPEGTRCELMGPIEALSDLDPGGCADLSVPWSTTLYLRCYGEPGHGETSLPVSVGPAIRRFEATPSFVTRGGDTTLSWEAPAATGCRLSVGGVWQDVAADGERRVSVTGAEAFELACDGGLGATTSAVALPYVDVPFTGYEARTRLIVSYQGWFASACEATARGGDNAVSLPRIDPAGGVLVLDVPPLASGDWSTEVTCDSPFGEATGAGPSATWTPLPTVDPPVVTPSRVPLGGGRVTVCWDEPEAEYCALFWDGNGDPEGEGGGVGCASRLVLYPQEATLLCCQGGRCANAVFGVEVGAGIERLVVDPPRLDAPGEVTVSWSSVDTERCALTADGEVVSDALSHDGLTLTLAETTELLLRCTDGLGFDDARRNVIVGAEVLAFEARAIAQGVHLSWLGEGLASCALDVMAGDESWHFTGLGLDFGDPRTRDGQGDYFLALDPSAGVSATLTCAADDGATHTRTVTLDPVAPVEIVAATADPSALAAPGAVDLCWTANHASACSVDWIDADAFYARYDLPSIGCLSDTAEGPVTIDTPTTFAVTCFGPLDSARAEVPVALGPAITRFEADATALVSAAEVTLSWDTFAVTGCTLSRGTDELATGTAGVEAVAVSTTTTFVLRCVTIEGAPLSRELTVAVGPTILSFSARVLGPEVFETTHRAVLVDSCLGTLRLVGGGALTTHGLPAEGSDMWYFPLVAEGDVEVVLTCEGPTGSTSSTIRVDAPAPAHLVQLTPSPALPAAGGEVDVCWEATGVDACWVYAGPYAAGGGASGCLSDLVPGPLTVSEHTPAGVSCDGLGGHVDRQVVIPVGPYIAHLSVEPVALAEPGPATITWRVENAASCTLSAGGATLATTLEGTLTRTFEESTDLTLRCHDGAATTERHMRVTVGPDFLQVGAEANSIDSVFVYWGAPYADRCEVERLAADGSVAELWADQPADTSLMAYGVPLIDGEARFVVRCYAGTASFERALVVPAVEALEVVTFEARPFALDAPGELDLCWRAEGAATTCYIRAPLAKWGALVPALPPEGCWSEVTGDPLTLSLTTPFELSCTGLGGGDEARLLVPVGPAVVSFVADPPVLGSAGSTTLSWRTWGAKACELVHPGGQAEPVPAKSGSQVVLVDKPMTFTLRCEDADGQTFEDALTVGLGPTILDLAVGAVSWDSLWIDLARHDLELCSVDLLAVDGGASTFVGDWMGLGLTYWDFSVHGDVEVLVTCFGPNTVVSTSAVVTSPLPAIPSFGATPETLSVPGPATLCWAAERADGCMLEVGDLARTVPTTGCNDELLAGFRVFSETTTATLSCDNEHGTSEATTTVYVGPSITHLDASPGQLPPGGFFTTLIWEAAHVGGCALSDGAELLATAASGSLEVWVGATTTFTLACTTPSGGVGPSAEVVVWVP